MKKQIKEMLDEINLEYMYAPLIKCCSVELMNGQEIPIPIEDFEKFKKRYKSSIKNIYIRYDLEKIINCVDEIKTDIYDVFDMDL